MVGPLKHFSVDPNRHGRGAGWYYHRGKGWFSKYDGSKKGRDFLYRRGPVPWNAANKKDPYRHTEDFKNFYVSRDYPTNTALYRKKHDLRPATLARAKVFKPRRVRPRETYERL